MGIAEEHAVSMAGGLAKQGMIPVVALYSTFLQRAYDQIIQDVALLGLHVVFAIDRAGLVGEDGATHHGTFDVGFLRQIPGMLILAPASRAEQQDMLRWAIKEYNGPVAIRYPRGGDRRYRESTWTASFKTDSAAAIVCHRRGADVTFITYGTMLDNVLAAAERLSEDGIEATVLRLLTVSSFPIDCIAEELSQNKQVIIVEEVCSGSGISDALTIGMKQRAPHCIVNTLNLGPNFVTHGSVDTLYEHLGLDSRSIAAYTKEVLKHES